MYDIYLKTVEDEIYFYYQKSENKNYCEWINKINKIKINSKKNNTFYEFINNLNFKQVFFVKTKEKLNLEIYENKFYKMYKIYDNFSFFYNNLEFYNKDSIIASNSKFLIILNKKKEIL